MQRSNRLASSSTRSGVADHMLPWAELQRDLPDQVTHWAPMQRYYADAVNLSGS